MKLSEKTLKKLRDIINGDNTDHYRGGPKLVSFFNQLGFHDVYGTGFPARWLYTDNHLQEINGTPALEKCIQLTFAVTDFIGKIEELDTLIADFNQYITFDKWNVIRDNEQITFEKLDKITIPNSITKSASLADNSLISDINIASLRLNKNIETIMKERLVEINTCIKSNAPLAAIFLIGSVMEGILSEIASAYPKQFNCAKSTPKYKTGKPKTFKDWTLNNFIDVATEIGFLKRDAKDPSHTVRNFRNYIHPKQQLAENFTPNQNTAVLCLQILKIAIDQIGNYQNEIITINQNKTM